MTAGRPAVRWGDRHDPHAQARAAREAPLLLHSLTAFREIVAEIFRVRRVAAVVEIGVESGAASSMYAELGADTVYCVESAPTAALRADLAGRPALRLVEGASTDVLDHLPVADCYVLDGDHNYATVTDELGWIVEHAPDAVVLLHDLQWPWGRRDLYYQPSLVDPARRHPDVTDGPSVLHDGTGPDGFVGCGAFTCAAHAGGESNGVLTAVEDVVEGRGWTLAVVPAVFGFGVLVRDAAPGAGDLLGAVAPWTGSPLLAAMENNRLALYGRVLELQSTAARAGAEVASLRARLSEVEDLLASRQAAGSSRTRGISRLVRRW